MAVSTVVFFYRLGMFFCPLLPFIGLLKDVVLFYMRSWAVRVFNNAPKHLYRAEATINYYFALLLLLVIAIMFPVGWAVTRLMLYHTFHEKQKGSDFMKYFELYVSQSVTLL